MKLMRYGAKGAEKPGLVDAQGQVRDLSGVIADITAADAVAARAWRSCARSTRRTLPVVERPAASRRRGAAAASSSASA